MNITFKQWQEASHKRRQKWIDVSEDSEDEGENTFRHMLDAIHPSLRIIDFESVVTDWRSLQDNHELVNSNRDWGSSRRNSLSMSITEAIEQASHRMEDRMVELISTRVREEVQRMEAGVERALSSSLRSDIYNTTHLAQREPSADLLHIAGQDRGLIEGITPFATIDDPLRARYDVFLVVDDYEHTLQRFFIQPTSPAGQIASYGSEFNDYRAAVTHFIDPAGSPIASMMEASTSLSMTFHCMIDGVYRNFIFNQFPTSERTLMDFITTIFTDTTTSDGLYVKISKNVVGVSVNVINPYSGGAGRPQREQSWIKVHDYKNPYDNSCFYACIREIWKSMAQTNKVRSLNYSKMRAMLTGSKEDTAVSVDMLTRAEEVFGVKLIVLGSDKPLVDFDKPAPSDKTYEEMEGSYTIEYDTIHYRGDALRLVEHSSALLKFEKRGMSMTTTIDGELYHILSLHGSHYSNVVAINRPAVCVKCGSTAHSARQAAADCSIKLECLGALRDRLSPAHYQEAQPLQTSIVFDFETIVIDGVLHPYSVSWCKMESLDHVPDVVQCEIGKDCAERFMQAVHAIEGVKTLVGYNSSRFDNFIVFKRLMKQGTALSSSNCTIHNNQILRICTRSIRTWDICQFTKCTLDEACEAYAIEGSKLTYDHKHAQTLFDKHGWGFVDELGRDMIEQYNNNDVLITARLYTVITSSLRTITHLDPLKCMTLSQLAYKHMGAYNSANGLALDKVPLRYDGIFDTVPAGRVQMFVDRGVSEGDYVQVDANGLYQYVCLNWDMPNGQEEHVQDLEQPSATCPDEEGLRYSDKARDRLCFVRCDVDQTPLPIKLVGQKKEDDRIDWTLDRVEDTWLWGEEIALLESLNCLVKKKEMLVWPEKIRPFGVMDLYKDIRAREKAEGRDGGVVDKMAKLMSNAITGKTYQRNNRDEWAIVWSLPACESFRKNHGDVVFDTTDVPHRYYVGGTKTSPQEFINKPRHMGARIYAMARLYMFSCISSLTTIKYMDTDGFIMDREEYNATPHLQHSVELGGFKIEAEGDRLYMCSLKNYALCTTAHTLAERGLSVCVEAPHPLKADKKRCEDAGKYHNKYRLKGYHNNDPWYAEAAEDRAPLSRSYQGAFVNEDMYRALIEGTVFTDTDKLVKRFVQKHGDNKYHLSTLYSQNQTRVVA